VVAIYSTLGPAQALAEALREHNLLRVSVGLVLLLVSHRLAMGEEAPRPGRDRALGVEVVYLIALIRIQSPEERTHLIEYTLVAILIHQALTERLRHGPRRVLAPVAIAVAVTVLLGWLDEGIQAQHTTRIDIALHSDTGLEE